MKKEIDFIVCNTCLDKFSPVFSETQAVLCASNVVIEKNEKAIYSHYGSNYDTERFISNGINEHLKTGIICDNCISIALSKKEIKIDNEFSYNFF